MALVSFILYTANKITCSSCYHSIFVCKGFCYTLCYAAVVTKTNRISRIFSAKKSHPSCTSPAASVMISLSLAMVEVGVNVCWLIFEPASTKHIFEPNQRILVCSGKERIIFYKGLAEQSLKTSLFKQTVTDRQTEKKS